jgi:zinc transporter ZupT
MVLNLSVLLGVAIPLGALFVAAAGALIDDHLGLLLGGAAGALTYVATGHLLPEAQSEERLKVLGVAFAATLLLSVYWFTVLVTG